MSTITDNPYAARAAADPLAQDVARYEDSMRDLRLHRVADKWWRLAEPRSNVWQTDALFTPGGLVLVGDTFTRAVSTTTGKMLEWWLEDHSPDYLAGKFFDKVFSADMARADVVVQMCEAANEGDTESVDFWFEVVKALDAGLLDDGEFYTLFASSFGDRAPSGWWEMNIGAAWPNDAARLVAIHRTFRRLHAEFVGAGASASDKVSR